MSILCRCFIVGEGSLVVRAGETLLGHGHAIAGVITAEPGIASWAESQRIPRILPSEDIEGFLGREPFDFLFSIVNLKMLPERVISLPRRLAINFHDGPLPRYAGLYATSWALLAKERRYGVTWHVMTNEPDTGDILKQKAFDIGDEETAFSLNAKCYTAGIEAFEELAQDLTQDHLTPVPQNLAERTYFELHKRPEAACALSFDRTAEDLAAFARALDFGPYPNPLGCPKIFVGDRAFLAGEIGSNGAGSGQAAGTIVAIGDDGLDVATATDVVRMSGLRRMDGTALSAAEFRSTTGLEPGSVLTGPDAAFRGRLTRLNERACRSEAFWTRRLENHSPIRLPFLSEGGPRGEEVVAIDVPVSPCGGGDELAGVVLAFLARLSSEYRFDVAFSDPALRELVQGAEAAFADTVPCGVELDDGAPVSVAREAVRKGIEAVRKRGTFALDLWARQPSLSRVPRSDGGKVSMPVALVLTEDLALARPRAAEALTVAVSLDGKSCRWIYDRSRVDEAALVAASRQLEGWSRAFASAQDLTLSQVPIVSDDDRRKVLEEWNATSTPFPEDRCVHSLFEEEARRRPEAVAVAFRDRTLSYAELDRRADALAVHLVTLGVGPDRLVGVFMDRSEELLVTILGILKAGGAYVPLDPGYPAERIAFMIEDSALSVIVVHGRVGSKLPSSSAAIVAIDELPANPPGARPRAEVTPRHLAYVIYTSGSTGKPKGVMIEHRNVVNFFTGMDDRLGQRPGDTPGTWLAVTSLNFDISVLELLWTLARGFKVVVYSDDDRASGSSGIRHAGRKMDFSAFYFSSDDGQAPGERYRLLIEGAKLADANGFCAVWTPERHFHAFGGLFPNPSVASAALAMITKNVALRAGSCVSPLHSPIRVAEEWSLVDNLSGGRVGISFAAGWQPNDFVLRPENFKDRKNQMFRDIETVKQLWRGETVRFPGPVGKDVEVRTLPRPIQKELPVWVTVAGNPETFEMAAKAGANVLTHLLGQTFDEVREKVALYRRIWREAGHAGSGIVTLMLHTFVGDDDAAVKEIVRGPMKEYLRSAVGLIKDAAWSFPTFKQSTTLQDGSFGTDHLTPEEMDALLDHSFERYYGTGGLFGSIDTALAIVDQAKGLDVDEIACLVDFGVPTDLALESLARVAIVRERANAAANDAGSAEDNRIPALVHRHGITHLQCTPSMASMLVADRESQEALRHLRKMMVGGEALSVPLAQELERLVPGDVINMYGPTETTIWSSTHAVKETRDAVPIGRPIANTEMILLDARGQLVPVGALGELCIGGEGVARGYLRRPELTQERFIAHPFRSAPGARLYRTGDLARFRPDGVLEYHGRLDHQVKIRGYRMELGEIEAVLATHPDVREAVVIAREDTPGDKRLVAYVVPRSAGTEVDPTGLLDHARESLPDYMIPSACVTLSEFPQTPNRKIDRKALPAPEQVKPSRATEYVEPGSALEETIADIWRRVLNVPLVGIDDNFFDLGGHSLLVVRVLDALRPKVETPINLVDLFRFPTIRTLSEHLARPDSGEDTKEQGALRGEARREGMGRRLALQQRRRGR